MDVAKYKAISRELSAELDALAKKYDLSNYGFIGFVGEPGKGHVPLCIHAITKEQFRDHLHIKLAKAVFLKAVDDLAKIGGHAYDISFSR